MSLVRDDAAPGADRSATGACRRSAARVTDQALLALVAVAIGTMTGFGTGWRIATALGVYAHFVGSVLAGPSIGERVVGLTIGPTEARHDRLGPTVVARI